MRPPHYDQYGLLSEEPLNYKDVLHLYDKGIEVALKCLKKHGHLYIKLQNQAGRHTSFDVHTLVQKYEGFTYKCIL